MKVVEVDSVFNDVIGATDITCAPLSSTLVFNDRRAGAYTVEASVELGNGSHPVWSANLRP